jgi:hypothetical protein
MSVPFIYPPRPKGNVSAGDLPDLEKTGLWVAQRKYNGQHIGVFISASPRKTYFFNQQGSALPDADILPAVREEFLSLKLRPNLDYWLDGEFLNRQTKTAAYKNRFVLYDVLLAGDYLFGRPKLKERLELLSGICRNPKKLEPGGLALRVSEHLWVAETFDRDLLDRYHDFIDLPEIEGLVLKKQDSVIDDLGRKPYDASWLIRCRKF